MPEYEPLYNTVGRVGRRPERKHLPDGRVIASFSVAETRGYGNGPEDTRWIDVSVFKDDLRAVVEANLNKGQIVAVTGTSLREHEYGGKTYYSMIAHRVGRVDMLQPAPRAAAPAVPDDGVEDF